MLDSRLRLYPAEPSRLGAYLLAYLKRQQNQEQELPRGK